MLRVQIDLPANQRGPGKPFETSKLGYAKGSAIQRHLFEWGRFTVSSRPGMWRRFRRSSKCGPRIPMSWAPPDGSGFASRPRTRSQRFRHIPSASSRDR